MGKRAQAGVAQPAGKVGKTQRGADFPEAAAHLAEIHQAVQQIAKHPVLQDILTAEPVEFGARDKWGNVGYKHPFNVQQYRNAMMSQGAAEFAGNFFWCNPCWLALHGVPPNKRQLLEISDRDFAEPVEFPDCITLAAPDKHFPDGQKHVDWFKRVTPEEVVHAYLLAVARDAQDVETPPETMTLWRKYLLSTTFRVVLASGEAVHWLTVKHREEMTRRFQAVQRTALQRVFEVVAYLQQQNALPAPGAGKTCAVTTLAHTYANYGCTAGGERITENFIVEAVRLWRSLLSHKESRAILLELEEEFGHRSPLNGVSRLAELAKVCRGSSAEQLWVLSTVQDRLRSGQMQVSENLSAECLSGRSAGGKGLVQLYLYKRELQQDILQRLMAMHPLQPEVATKIKQIFSSHVSYREQCKPYSGEADISYTVAWPRSGHLIASILEDTIYSKETDPLQKVALRARKSVREYWEYDETGANLQDSPSRADNAVVGSVGQDDEGGEETWEDRARLQMAQAGCQDAPVLERFVTKASRLVTSHVQLVTMEMSETELADALSNTPALQVSGTQGLQYCALLLDSKLSGEAVTSPHIRTPAYAEDAFRKLVAAFTKAKGSCGSVLPGSLVMVADAGKMGGLTNTDFKRLFLDEESKVIRDNKSTLLYLAYSHEQLAKRRRATKVRGGNLQLMEVLTIFWGERPEIPRRDRLVYKLGSQTNEGNLLSAIQYQPWPQCWALPFSKKKELFGPFRRPVGGTTAPEGVDEEVEEQCQAVRRSRFFPLCALMGVRRCQATADASAVEELPGATGLAVNAGRGSCAKRVDTNL
ncbi:unnamed protein product, partial [Effrenium voratum]